MQEGKHVVSVNGFTLENKRTILGFDGPILTADLVFRGRKLCEYFDEGGGKPYLAYPVGDCTAERIEKAVSAFSGDIRTLVDEIVVRMKVLGVFRKAERKGQMLVWMRSEKEGMSVMAPADPALSDGDAIAVFREKTERENPAPDDAVYTVMRREDDIDVNDTEVDL